MVDTPETMTLEEYKIRKAGLLRSLGFKNVTRETFAECKTEIQVDNRAHSIIVS